MNIAFQKNGNLVSGVHELTISQLEFIYGYNERRKMLIAGLKLLIYHLSNCGCKTIYIDGSFVSKKALPNDFDACWDTDNVDLEKISKYYPIIFDFSNNRQNQKDLYGGEFFPMSANATPPPLFKTFYDFFQQDRDGVSKGIIKIKI